jgi:hypothetical protein
VHQYALVRRLLFQSRQNEAEDFNVQTLTYQISSLAVKASVPDLLEVGMRRITQK